MKSSGDTVLTEIQQFFSDGSLAYTLEYRNGYPHGKYHEWYSNNVLCMSGSYQNGLRAGKWKYFDSDGRIDSTRRFENGHLNGKYFVYNDEEKRIVKGSYLNGKKHKKWEWISEDGETYFIRTFNLGKLDGESKDYYPNGSLKRSAEYVNNRLHGSYDEFSESGQPVIKGIYDHSIPNGEWTWWTDGDKSRLITYKNGVKHGHFSIWHPEGKQQIVGSYQKDMKDGTFNYWSSDGHLDSTRSYSKGILDGISEDYDPQSNAVIKQIIYQNGKKNGKRLEWYSNGIKRSIISYSDGIKEGEYVYWFSNGQIMERGSYQKGQYDGFIQRWYSNGNRSSESLFSEGIQHGPMKIFSPTGIQKKEVLYHFGEPIFLFEYYENSLPKGFIYFANAEEKWAVQWDKYGVPTDQENTEMIVKDLYTSGNPKRSIVIKDGSPFILEFQYFSDRTFNQITFYKNEEKLIQRSYPKDGNLLNDQIWIDGNLITFEEGSR